MSDTAAWMVLVLLLGSTVFATVKFGQSFGAPSPHTMVLEMGSLATQTLNWSKTYGGINEDVAFAVVQTNDGGYAIAGSTETYGAGLDFWLLKTDAYGNEQWNKTYGGVLAEHAYSVVQTSDGGYALAGITYSFGAGTRDIWLVKTDAYGNAEWNKTYGGSWYDTTRSMIQTNDSGYAIIGSHGTFLGDYSDFYLVKTDENGNMSWNRTYGGTNTDWGRSVVQTRDGGYAIAGYTNSFGEGGDHDFWLVKADAFGNAQWNKTYGGAYFDEAHSVVQTSDGGYVLAGCTQSNSAGSYNLCLVKTDSFGNTQWNNTYGETDGDHEVSMVQTDDGGFAMVGDTRFQSAGGFDFLLVKIDSFGNAQWNRTYGGSETECAWFLMQTGDRGYVLAGYTYSFGAGRSDAWLIKTDENGFVIPEFPVLTVLLLFQLAVFTLMVLAKKRVRLFRRL